ncbi:glycosyl transferase group 1 [Candidatus Vecturithrix granuli]|uniref:Glycosyl transferase group 1 n=1 Tax=Vecturithrix granuli TaxID=1499967 RepID=A0A081BXU5_VECG1|nr:glycosyl transferase group 1 [Candidatus Vecturithrix granuli]
MIMSAIRRKDRVMKILILNDYYLPGYKSGGPLRTLVNMVERLGEEFAFFLMARDRDAGDRSPYPEIQVDAWQYLDRLCVFYASPRGKLFRKLRTGIFQTGPDLLYLNSMFSAHFTITPLCLRRLFLLPRIPVILAPRGMLSPGAIELKGLKKQVFLHLAQLLRLYHGIVWQASSEYEAEDIRCIFGGGVQIVVAPDIVAPSLLKTPQPASSPKQIGELKLIFLSRIDRKKNLDAALMMLREIQGNIQFHIYGPVKDQAYWEECQQIIKELPPNIHVQYYGTVLPENVSSLFSEYALFFFPTRSENFGHVILEALSAGCPVLISDQTPWRDLETSRAGWVVPLNQPERFREILKISVNMDQQEHRIWREHARNYAERIITNDEVLDQNRQLFYTALEYGKSNNRLRLAGFSKGECV